MNHPILTKKGFYIFLTLGLLDAALTGGLMWGAYHKGSSNGFVNGCKYAYSVTDTITGNSTSMDDACTTDTK
jgi:hypothetical protein